MKKIIFFRGRNTAAIMNDARKAGLIPDDAKVVIICRDDDRLAEPGDIQAGRMKSREQCFMPGDDWTIVANGGTSAQLAPLLADACFTAGQMADKNRQTVDENEFYKFRLRIVDVQKENARELWHFRAFVAQNGYLIQGAPLVPRSKKQKKEDK